MVLRMDVYIYMTVRKPYRIRDSMSGLNTSYAQPRSCATLRTVPMLRHKRYVTKLVNIDSSWP
jgi:hypothetical protein